MWWGTAWRNRWRWALTAWAMGVVSFSRSHTSMREGRTQPAAACAADTTGAGLGPPGVEQQCSTPISFLRPRWRPPHSQDYWPKFRIMGDDARSIRARECALAEE